MRNLFLLQGTDAEEVKKVLSQLQFKGLNVLISDAVTKEDISNIFSNNKSVACLKTAISDNFSGNSIIIKVGLGCKGIDTIDTSVMTRVPEQFAEIAKYHNCDIGDFKSNDSGISGEPTKKDCEYCNGYLSSPIKVHYRQFVYQSKNFVAFPTLGQFITGYLLIVPREHIMSMAQLSKEACNEFMEVLEDCIYILKLTYPNSPNILVWENGTGGTGKGKAKDSVVHAHTHLAPSKLNADIIKNVSKLAFNTIPTEELSNYGENSYLLLRVDNNMWYINDNHEVYIPRQYIRQLIGEEYGFKGEEWNWRTNPYYENILKTTNDVKDCLKEHWDDLPERIKRNTQHLFKPS